MKKYKIGKSKIHGKGVICTRPIKHGEVIDLVFDKINTTGIADRDWLITDMGSYVNHSWKPNSRLIKTGNSYYLQALKNIHINEEITADYNDSPDFISKANPLWD